MASVKPQTIPEYIQAAPEAGRPHLQRVYEILQRAAPDAQETIKWGAPFFVEPRFLFSFSAHKAHLSLAPTAEALIHFRDDIGAYKTTTHFLKVSYDEPLPDDLIRRIAEYRVQDVAAREDNGFW